LTVVLLTPVVLALFAFAVLAGRLGTAHQDVVSAAQAAARAASLYAGGTASGAAEAAAAQTLRSAGIECASTTVSIGDGGGPGAAVSVTVACAVKLADLTDLALPGATTVRATASAPVDVYRGAP
jgi:Flp pilus assembly protein TadG